MLQCTFHRMDLDENETCDNFSEYLDRRTVDRRDVNFKENTSLTNPILLIEGYNIISELDAANYCAIYVGYDDSSEENGHFRYYYITDIVPVALHMCEVYLRFDAFRTFDWFHNDTEVRACLTSEYNYWSKSCDDPRWQPLSAYGPYMGVHTRLIPTGLPGSAAKNWSSPILGCFLVKFWWGYAPDETHQLGIVNAMMDAKNFEKMIYDVNHFIEDHWGSQLGGINDFTKFIISAKYIPDLVLEDAVGHALAHEAGYAEVQDIGIGGLCTSHCDCFIKKNTAGYVKYQQSVTGPQIRWQIGAISGNKSPTNYAPSKDLQFLLSSKWTSCIIDSPVGTGCIPLDNLQDTDQIQTETMLDFESGNLTLYFYKYDSGCRDVLLTLSGCVAVDITNAFTHIQSASEVIQNTLTQNMIQSASSFVGGYGDSFGSTLQQGKSAGKAWRAGDLGGSLSVVQSVAQAPFQVMSDLTKPRVVNMPLSPASNDRNFLHLWNNSLSFFRVTTIVYMNPDTPVWDPNGYRTENSWNADALWENYCNWCQEKWHGYPSNKYLKGAQIWSDSKGLGYSYIKCSDVLKIGTNQKLMMRPEYEAEIKQKLYEGVVILHNAN